MKIEGYLIDQAMTIALKVLVCSMRPNPKFPKGGYMLRLKTGKTLMVYSHEIPSEYLPFHMKKEAKKQGYLLFLKGLDDQAISDIEDMIVERKGENGE